jgi:hypothetical protein
MGFCELSNEVSRSVKGGEFCGWVNILVLQKVLQLHGVSYSILFQ